jgi:hypothetical protein
LSKLIILSDYQRGFIEGMLDGEGCISLCRPKNQKAYLVLHPEIKITNTNYDILNKISKMIDNRCSINKRKSLSIKHKPCYLLRIHSDAATEILSQMKLTIKEKKRKIVLKVFEILRKRQHGFGRWNLNYKNKQIIRYYKEFYND